MFASSTPVALSSSFTEDDMTSIRGQNVSFLQFRGTQPLEFPSTARRAVPISSFKIDSNERSGACTDLVIDSNSYTKGRDLNQHSLENYLSETYGPGRSSNTSALSSYTSCGVRRELSPVQWCDRDVDEVYLRRSGWVQTQQKSLDDSRETRREPSSAASTLRSRKFSSNFNSNTDSLGRAEQNRPVNLPLFSKRRASPDNQKTPYSLAQEHVTVPPSSVTPILSPPPAFRDERRDIEIPVHAARNPFNFEDSPGWRSRVVIDQPTSSVAEESGPTLSPISASKYCSRVYLQTKSLDEESLNKIPQNGRSLSAAPLALFASRSLDNDFRKTNCAKINGCNSSFKSVHISEDRGKISDQEDYPDSEEDRENCFIKHSSASQASSLDRLSTRRNAPSARRQRRFQLNGKRISLNDSVSANRTRSPSLDSNSSSESSAGGRSAKKNSRRFTAKQYEPKGDHFIGEVSKHFGVKRSKSLQLPEDRSPHEPMSMSHSSSEKSWDHVSTESATFPIKNEYDRHYSQSFRNLHNVMVAVNGQGIPVISPDGQSASLLNGKFGCTLNVLLDPKKVLVTKDHQERSPSVGITTSEEEQLKLIREAAKEAKVISEFLSGTKSRAAARSLLLHRYFNRSEAPDFNREEAPAKFQGDTRFIHFQQPSKNETITWNGAHMGSSPQDTQRHSDNTKPLAPSIHPSNSPIPFQNPHPLSNYPHLPKNHMDSSATHSKWIQQKQPFPPTPVLPKTENPLGSPAPQRQGFPSSKQRSTRQFQSPPTGITVTSFFENVNETPVTVDPPIDFRRRQLPLDAFRQNSSTSSSSADAPQHNFHSVTANAPKVTTSSDLSLDSLCLHSEPFASNDNSPIRHLCCSRPASAPAAKDCASLSVHRRSLSLPRSFLSEHCAPHYFARRDSFPWRRHQLRNVEVYAGQWPAKSAASDTHPIATSRRSRDGRNVNATIRDKSSTSHKKRKLRNRTSIYDGSDGHDCGTRLEIRHNADSAECQNDDLLLDGSHGGIKTWNGEETLTTWDVQDHESGPVFRSSSLRSSQTTSWEDLNQDSAPFSRLTKNQLRRSLSLNELPPEETQNSARPQCRAFSEDENPFEGNSEGELSSDSESSERNQSFCPAQKDQTVAFAEAVWDHIGYEPFELSFRAGDVIQVLNMSDRHWWWGDTGQNYGYFPSAFVRVRTSPTEAVAPVQYETSSSLRRSKSSLLSREQVRSNVVRELLNTERDFVKILRGVKHGYMAQCSRRPDMFTSAQISTIFSNLDDILIFQEEFLKDLEGRIDPEFPQRSCVGEAFLNHSSGFRMYSEYCNFHPMAMAVLQELYRKDKYRKFFEMCRLKQNLSEIPLDGYLLTPVQRICKYPLQLAELLKYTKPDHPDFGHVQKALETMRSVATLINERKRKMERLEKLAAWQRRVEGWEGDDLIELSSQLIYQGDVVRITSGMWTTNITLFLFDHQMIFCKKDLLKRHDYIYKGRICLDGSEVVDLADGKIQQLGTTIRYGIRISNNSKEKWLIFCCRSSEDKEKWLSALAEEKRIVAHDKEIGLDLPPTAKQLAKMRAMGTKKIIPTKLRGKNKIRSGQKEMSGVGDGRLSNVKVKGGRRMWFTFAGVMKSPKVSLGHRNSFQNIT